MTYYTLEDAQNQLQKLIASALRGEKVIIKVDGNDEIQLVTSNKTRKPGSAEGLIKMADDFDDPLDDFSDYPKI